MRELPVSSQMQVGGGFVIPFVVSVIAVATAVNVARLFKGHYSITRHR
ncbi:MAG: hypothetical protein ACLR9T_04750 [Thomasclavelia sp.]